MEHLAIMRKSLDLLSKILSGEKTIESRWYKNKYTPWDKIKSKDIVYFKNSGEPVTVKANVSSVLQFSDLTPASVSKLLYKYGKNDSIPKKEFDKHYEMFKNKKYCLLIFLKNTKCIKPFEVSKKGFDTM